MRSPEFLGHQETSKLENAVRRSEVRQAKRWESFVKWCPEAGGDEWREPLREIIEYGLQKER